jgi:holo-[acyl-carrier protein] synthase
MLVGVDIIENDRFARAIERRPRLIERVFTAAERSYCLSKADPARHFAARFAAKEAVGKALGTGVISWQEIEIASQAGRPEVSVSGGTRAAAEQLAAGALSISLSHSDTVSVAVAVARTKD